MALSVDNHLAIIREELYKARTKWYDIGLTLKVPVTTLDSIEGQFGNDSKKLLETLKIWLKTATEPSWQDVVGVLKRPVVGEPKLASDIEAKYCSIAETGQASGPTMPEVQPQLITRGTELHTLQQALQDSRELRIKDQQLQDSQRRIHTLQQELQTKDQQLQDTQGRTHTLQQELQDSQGCTHTLQQKLQTKDQQLQDSQGRTHTLQQELQDSQRRTHTLQQKLQTKDKQLQDSQGHTHTLQQELQESQGRTHTLQQELQDSQRRTHTLQQELQDSQGHTHTLQQELQHSQGRTHTLQQELQDSQKRTHTLQQELQKRIAELTQQAEKKNQMMESIEKDLLQREQTIGELRADIDQLKRQLQQAQQQVQQATERERQVRGLNVQLLAMKWPGPPPSKTVMQQQPINMPQVGTQPHETITPPMLELQRPEEKQHATGYRQLQPMKWPGPPPQKTVMQQQPINMPQVATQPHKTIAPPMLELQQPEEKQHATGYRQLPMNLQQNTIPYMKWKNKSKAPEKMFRGSTATDADRAYFNGWGHTTVYSCNSDTREWCRLPDAPHTNSTLVVVHYTLTMVGGQISGRTTDSLLSLTGEGRGKKWLPSLPAMPTKRYLTGAVCSGHSLIVAGGLGEDKTNRLATVEVLDTDTRQWSIASSLPHPFSQATVSICGERLYIMGRDWTSSVLSCSVPELLQSCQTQPLAGKLRTAPAKKSTIWRHVNAPHYLSSCATLCGRLVAVGGFRTSAISVYNETTDSWEAMGDMPTARSEALVAVLNGKMMVVGGKVVVKGKVVSTAIATHVVEILC